MRTCYIIAEAGSSHDGRLDQALMLVMYAAWAKCSAVKFQLFKADTIASRRHAGGYIESYRHYEVPVEWLPRIKESCINHKIDLVLSVYSVQDFEVASAYADVIKVASFESQDRELLNAVSLWKKPVVISSGMSTHEELAALTQWRLDGANARAVLHCISCYPTRMQDLQLNTIHMYDLDGFSDHSANIRTGALAVACGAKILEVHLKLFTTLPVNPDFGHSLDPTQLKEYVFNAREASMAVIAPQQREIALCEIPMSAYRVVRL